jgi:hypothetical protein
VDVLQAQNGSGVLLRRTRFCDIEGKACTGDLRQSRRIRNVGVFDPLTRTESGCWIYKDKAKCDWLHLLRMQGNLY